MMLMPKLPVEENFRCRSTPPSRQEGSVSRLKKRRDLLEEAKLYATQKEQTIKLEDENGWREALKRDMELALDQRVREALETPPLERLQKNKDKAKLKSMERNFNLNSHLHLDLTDKERDYIQQQQWKVYQRKRRKKMKSTNTLFDFESRYDFKFRDSLSKSNHDEYPGVFGLETASGDPPGRPRVQLQLNKNFLQTKDSFREAMLNGKLPDGSSLKKLPNGKYIDKYGIVRDEHGPFWPEDYSPVFGAPKFNRNIYQEVEVLYTSIPPVLGGMYYENQVTSYTGRWRGISIIYDADKNSRDYQPLPIPDGCCPSLMFESRFECGNLQQARRVGQHEYELVLKTDLYTKRHTQWYYFRIKNTVPGIIYKFRIVNLLKKDSLYNQGMQPLFYSEKEAKSKNIGWIRKGHHISYGRNSQHLSCPLLLREIAYYELEFQMEFAHGDDTCYLAHCYPYTFTDLKNDLDDILGDEEKCKVMVREVMCETKAGNSCFLLTITDFENTGEIEKKAAIITARVHPGESNASWMMKGLLDFLTSSQPTAKELRKRFIFKIVPMLNPDGVIVGNYRCSLQSRDLNRNYRHPKQQNFPTVWHTKDMLEKVAKNHEIILYCDMHGHSRKNDVFMYGCSSPESYSGKNIKEFLSDRLIPYLMSQKAPDKFSFKSCKFHIKRCKESTGRVVMWRQYKIANAFTLEATFSGTSLCSDQPHHFTTTDLESVGQTLAEVLLEYQSTIENKEKESEVILDLTREITQQILEIRGMTLPKDYKDNTKESMKLNKDSKEENNSQSATSSSHQAQQNGAQTTPVISKDLVLSEIESITSRQNSAASSKSAEIENLEQLLESVSKETIDGCVEILTQLHIDENCSESDSSDSDSESEAEMPENPHEELSKRKKKKKKSKKHPHDDGRRSHDKKSIDETIKSTDSARSLPALRSCDLDSAGQRKKQVPANSRCNAFSKNYPGFVNKYEGLSNGGIPCFSEKRSLERAAKRMAEMKKRNDRPMDFMPYHDDDYLHSLHAMPQDSQDLRRRFHMALTEGTSNITEALGAQTQNTPYDDTLFSPRDSSTDSDSDDARFIHNHNYSPIPPPFVHGQRIPMFGKFAANGLPHRGRSLTPMNHSKQKSDASNNWTHRSDREVKGVLMHELLGGGHNNPTDSSVPRHGYRNSSNATEMLLHQLHKQKRMMNPISRLPRQTTWFHERHFTCE